MSKFDEESMLENILKLGDEEITLFWNNMLFMERYQSFSSKPCFGISKVLPGQKEFQAYKLKLN